MGNSAVQAKIYVLTKLNLTFDEFAVVTVAHGSFPMSHSPKPGTMRIGSGLLLFRELILLLFFNQAEQLVEILCGNIRQLCDAYAFHFRHSFSNRRNIGWLIGFTTKRHGCQIW